MNIDIHGARDLAVKGFGLYCLAIVVSLLSSQIVLLFSLLSGGEVVAVAGSFFLLLGYATLGYLCVFRTRAVMRLLWRSTEPVATSPPLSSLAALVSLIGVYFAIRSAGYVASYAWQFRHPNFNDAGYLSGAVIGLACALWLVRRPTVIAEYILRRELARN
jgi:hypothetical protein